MSFCYSSKSFPNFFLFFSKKVCFLWFLCLFGVKIGFDEGGEGVFSIKRRKRIVVSDIFLNFAFAILVGCSKRQFCSCCYIYNKV